MVITKANQDLNKHCLVNGAVEEVQRCAGELLSDAGRFLSNAERFLKDAE